MLICDTHADTLYALYARKDAAPDITMERLAQGGVSLQTMALWTGPKGREGDVKGVVAGELKALEDFKRQGLAQLDDPRDAREGTPAILLSVEGGEVFEDGLETIAFWRGKGVRMAALTWNHENRIGFPAKGGWSQGLTDYGVKAVKEMQKAGIAVDTSHLNERGFFDIFAKTNLPPMASHSCCRALRDHVRNLTDEQLRLLIQSGGYMGVNFYVPFLSDGPCTLDAVVCHIDHVCQMGGEKNVGFGSDFDGIDEYPKGLEHPGCLPALIDALEKRGYPRQAVEGIAGGNLLAYFDLIDPRNGANRHSSPQKDN